MKNKKSFWLLAAAMILLIGGAGILYNQLGDQLQTNQLGVYQETEATAALEPAATAVPPAATAAQTAEAPAEATEAPAEAAEKPAEATATSDAQAEAAPVHLVPDFTVYDAAGSAVTLHSFFGKPVVLNFWASWCGPCKSEMPDFQKAYEAYGNDIHFVMVNLTDGGRETVEKAQSFIDQQGYTFPVYFDTDVDAAMTYGVASIPTTYFIGADGSPVAWGQGALNAATLERGIGMIANTP